MKYSIYAALALMSLASCENNDNRTDDARPVDKQAYQFKFHAYKVRETVLYTGSWGQKSNPEESYLSNYWSSYQEPVWKEIYLDMKNSSLKLISGTSADLTYSIKIVNDSVLINDNSGKPDYIGDFNANNSTFTLKRTLRYLKRVPRNESYGLTIAKSFFFGTTEYSNMFGIIFNSPTDMTQSEDVVLWSNVEYYYKKE
ncbi:hypothetical protein F3J23_02860 [Chryseobacterium sp. Tr-659]|uniref:hypothetical protein n=1 Tax=Chryseobacterium sp. Tr-659 TaxID=2608340 RepID=UPI00142257B4|nr:hypothetical protein [Chryseobacterium sp. Tr-659]NIF04371.1 hypothetical protein [Chryseobacterium sp. Tr-659]